MDLWARRSDADTLDPAVAVFDTLLAGSLAGLSAGQQALLAALPVLSPEVGAAAGWPTMVDDLTTAGIPLRRTGVWWTLGDVVRERLGVRAPVPAAGLEACAAVYARRGQLTHAIDLLFRADRADALPATLVGLPPTAFESADLDEVVAVLAGLPDRAWADAPAGALAVAMAAESRARLAVRGRVLDRLATVPLDGAAAQALAVERLRDLAHEGAIDATLAQGVELLPALSDDQPGVRARCLYALGWAASLRDDTASLLQATSWFAESAGAARSARSDDDRARALSALAYRVHLKRAEFERAVNRFEEALALMGPASHHRAATLTFLAETLTQIGRDDAALEALAEARAIARRMADTRMVAYCAWAAAKVAGRQRAAADLHHWLAEADANRGDWYAHLTGTEFCAVASELCSQCGDEAGAREWLARTHAHPRLPEYPDIAWAAECSIETRFGDPEEGERLLHRLLDEGYTAFSERWRFRLWIGWCRHRRGDLAGATEMVEAVRRETASFGHPDLPELHEPEMWTVLCAGGGATATAGESAVLRVHVFGGFAVSHGGRQVDVPGGKPQQLVKVLAVAGRPVPVDEMADLLWPDVDPEVGRRRLRNVVARVRAAGDLLERNDDLLALGTAVAVDLLDFESAAQGALRGAPGERGGVPSRRWSCARARCCRATATRTGRWPPVNAPGRSLPAWPRLCSPTPRRRATWTWRSWWASACWPPTRTPTMWPTGLPRCCALRPTPRGLRCGPNERNGSGATWGCERLPDQQATVTGVSIAARRSHPP